MKLLNKLITKTAIYKHLKDLYEGALKDNDAYFNRVNKLIDDKNKISEQLFHNMQVEYSKMQNDLKSQELSLSGWYQIAGARTKERDKLKTVLRKILTHVRKLDKKDENVKEIKRLIKEVLS